MNRLIRRRPYLVAAIVVALIVVVLLGGRAAVRLAWRLTGPPPPPRQTNVELIADWMSVPYISRAYRVPDPELYRALDVQPDGRRMQRLRDIAEETGRGSDEVVGLVRAAVSAWQVEHPGRPTPVGAPDPPLPPSGQRDAAPRGADRRHERG